MTSQPDPKAKSQAIKYLVWSGISFILNVGINISLVAMALSKDSAFVATTLILFVINFAACRFWIFIESSLSLIEQLKRFAIATAGFRVAEILIFISANAVLVIDHKLLVISVLLVSFIGKFVVQRMLVFGDS